MCSGFEAGSYLRFIHLCLRLTNSYVRLIDGSIFGAWILGRAGESVANGASGDQSDQSEHSSCALRSRVVLSVN